MPRITLQTAHTDGQRRRWTLSERIVAENLRSDHYVAQLVDRLRWATADAEGLESLPDTADSAAHTSDPADSAAHSSDPADSAAHTSDPADSAAHTSHPDALRSPGLRTPLDDSPRGRLRRPLDG
jgi:hypothetical protein